MPKTTHNVNLNLTSAHPGKVKYIAHYRDREPKEQTLDAHLTGVARLASDFAAKLGLPEQGELLGLLHDLGKYSEEFQNYLKSAVGLLNQDEDEDYVDAGALRGRVDHSTAGAQVIWEQLSGKGPPERLVAQILSLCIASHHSGLIDCLTSDTNSTGENNFKRRMAKESAKTHLDEALDNADGTVIDRANALLASANLVERLRDIVRDIWQKHQAKNISPHKTTIGQFKVGMLVRFLFSCLIDADRIDTADFERNQVRDSRQYGRYAGWDVLFRRLEFHLANLNPTKQIDELRQDISRHCLDAAVRSKGVFTLTVPTGGGKTLASLRFALHHANKLKLDRVIYVIPYTSIIDQNAQVVRAILEPSDVPEETGKVVLEHHSNLTPEQQGWREKILCENWDAPVIYTTMVQFLETLFGAGTRGARRMHQLANSVVIFDEVQTLPIRCVHLFNNAINFLVESCNSTVVLCTATQPLLQNVDAKKGAIQLHEQHELMPDVGQLFRDLKRVTIENKCKPEGWSDVEIADLALNELGRIGSCLVVVNTKSSAQSIYRLCAKQSDVPVLHLSTNMCPAHRKHHLSRIREMLDKGEPVLCVSTQLIEAGVDVDFGAVIRFLAGLDSIAQAAGRCNRNGLREIGIVHVLNPREQDLSNLDDIRIGCEKTERVLTDYDCEPNKYGGDRIGPETMNWYYKNYFWSRKEQMDYSIAEDVLGHADSLLSLLSVNHRVTGEYGRRQKTEPKTEPDIWLRQSFMAAAKAFKAIDAPTQGVIVPYSQAGRDLIAELCAAYDAEKEFDLLRQAQQFTVNVFPRSIDQLARAGALHAISEGTRIWCLSERYYSDNFGLVTEPIANMGSLYVDSTAK